VAYKINTLRNDIGWDDELSVTFGGEGPCNPAPAVHVIRETK